jgi:putative transposase
MDKQSTAVDLLLKIERAAAAARRFFEKSIQHDNVLGTVTTDKSVTSMAALNQLIRNESNR